MELTCLEVTQPEMHPGLLVAKSWFFQYIPMPHTPLVLPTSCQSHLSCNLQTSPPLFASCSEKNNDFFSSTWVIMFTVENLEVVGKHKEKNPIVILLLRNKPCYNFLQICFLFVCVLCACVIFLRYSQFFCSFFPLYFPFPSLPTSSR